MDRDEFMELVYETFADEPDNVLANGIIEAADAYAEHEKAQLFSEGTTKDTISRQAAIDIERNATVDTNPSHFEAHQKFTQFMDDAEISSFGRWQWSNGFNTALTAVGIDLKKLPSAQPERAEGEWINTNPEYENGFYNNSYYCSECHDYYTTSPYEMNYCPNCGAKMKGVKHETD